MNKNLSCCSDAFEREVMQLCGEDDACAASKDEPLQQVYGIWNKRCSTTPASEVQKRRDFVKNAIQQVTTQVESKKKEEQSKT